MAPSKILKQRTIMARGLEAQWPRWMQMAKTVPSLRIDKIQKTRLAMDAHHLESDAILDITIERLSEDLGLEEQP